MDMQQRIDALIQMRREKPEHKYHWHRLQQALITEPKLLTSEQSVGLSIAFDDILREELMELWDEQFHEVLITGKITDGYSIVMDNSFGSAPIRAEGSPVLYSTAQNAASWTTSSKLSFSPEQVEATKKIIQSELAKQTIKKTRK
jgi:hypothetical protein